MNRPYGITPPLDPRPRGEDDVPALQIAPKRPENYRFRAFSLQVGLSRTNIEAS
jgi:hypothetical protein